ncbi:G-type lectin S-receptor-like serine/threonine-protein kinase [Tanacetum coccineum]|uniref:G-type lectin S-receptor-like serine/threonine-protein kinase n=1 Tax=Tanacetum coccineum TaxID=301880 RepID=A0ABQ5HCA3_9ASTR
MASSASLSSQFHGAMLPHIVIFLLSIVAGSSGTTITVVNDCGFAVWPGISGNPDVNITGFKLPKGTSRAFQVPENWSGRIWGRTGCRFNKSGGWSCATGDCGTGEVECKGRNYTQPVTVAELNMTMGDDYYDVSLLSGFNLPMTIEAKGTEDSCPVTGCATVLNKRCPDDLKLWRGEVQPDITRRGGANRVASGCSATPNRPNLYK